MRGFGCQPVLHAACYMCCQQIRWRVSVWLKAAGSYKLRCQHDQAPRSCRPSLGVAQSVHHTNQP